MGHIISNKEISIDEDRVEAINQIPIPHNRKSMQSFKGRVNFVRKFVADFAQIVKPLQVMVKESVQFNGNDFEKVSFKYIKT